MTANAHDWARDKAEFVFRADGPRHPTEVFGSGPLGAEFAELTGRLLQATTAAEVLEQVVSAARSIVPGADLVSITLRSPDGRFHTPVETGPVATELDQVQYDTGEGPCLDAASKTGPAHVRSEDLAHEPAWPRFGPRAAEHGYTAVLSTTLLPEASPPRLSGALNIYARQSGALREQAQQVALLLATHASLALAGTHTVERAELQETHLRRAIDSRDVIGQAKGILMERQGISADDAFDLLVSTSQHLNIKLAELAGTVTARHDEL